eukprot:gene17683-48360_t
MPVHVGRPRLPPATAAASPDTVRAAARRRPHKTGAAGAPRPRPAACWESSKVSSFAALPPAVLSAAKAHGVDASTAQSVPCSKRGFDRSVGAVQQAGVRPLSRCRAASGGSTAQSVPCSKRGFDRAVGASVPCSKRGFDRSVGA